MTEEKNKAARAALLRDGEERCAARAAAAKEEEQKGKPPVIPLGEDGACNKYWSRPHRSIYSLKMNEHTATHLRRMAKLADYARWLAPDLPPDAVEEAERRILKQAKDRLIEETAGKKFDPACVRARGIWPDDETDGVIYNAGNTCYLVRPDGTMEEVDGVRGQYVYNKGNPLPAPAVDALTDAEGKTLLDLLTARPWVMPAYGELLAGWITCALLAGLMSFRPQVWINAPAETGKSALKRDVLRALGAADTTKPEYTGADTGNVRGGYNAAFTAAMSTEASVRQELDGSILPVVYDEAEGNGKEKEMKNLENILSLVRSAATDGGCGIKKGSADGISRKEYRIQSCFLLISIANTLERDADISRFMVLRLAPVRNKDDRAAMWKRQEAGRAMVQSASFTPRLLRRLLGAVPDLLKNAQAVKDRLMQAGQNVRRAEMVAHLVAGAYALTHKGAMTAEALQHAAVVAAAVEQAEERTSDTERCLAVLLGHCVTVGGRHYTVQQLCRAADGADIERKAEAEHELNALGMRWKQDKGLCVNPAAPAMREIYRGTDWSNGKIAPVLTAGEYGIRETRARLNKGHNSRRVLLIPAELVISDDEE